MRALGTALWVSLARKSDIVVSLQNEQKENNKMTYEIVEKEPISRIPRVGEFWKFADVDVDVVFLRIHDELGRKLMPKAEKDVFFSFDLKHLCVYNTDLKNLGGIVILQPAGGVLRLEPM